MFTEKINKLIFPHEILEPSWNKGKVHIFYIHRFLINRQAVEHDVEFLPAL